MHSDQHLDHLLSDWPFEPDGLQLRVPDGPGLGVELDWDKVRHYATDM